VSRDSAGRYFVSILLEEEIKPLSPSQENIGIDLGLTSMVITSSGEKVGNPRYFVREEKRLAKAQRRPRDTQRVRLSVIDTAGGVASSKLFSFCDERSLTNQRSKRNQHKDTIEQKRGYLRIVRRKAPWKKNGCEIELCSTIC
jgi:hypothetical protein